MEDMTKGSPVRHLIVYSVPLLVGNLLQLLYNAVDSIIAGRFIGQDALAAEGIASPVMNMIILIISGVTIGSGVLISEAFGAGDMKRVKRINATTAVLGSIAGAAVALLGVFLSRPILVLMDTPSEILDKATLYLAVTFLGVPFVFLFNALSSGLKSMGDSRTPLLFLAFSSILNAVLDIIFLGFLGFGIVCSATTTVVAEIVSAFASLIWMKAKVPEIYPEREDISLKRDIVLPILKYGGPTALQQALQPIGKLFIQSSVNSLGVVSIAAFNAATRLDSFALIPEQGIAAALSTFLAQNRGADKKERVMKGFRSALMLELFYGVSIGVLIFFLRKPAISLFVKSSDAAGVVREGEKYLFVMSFLYVLPALTNLVQGFFRGCGKMYTTIIGSGVQITVRTVFTFLLAPQMGIKGVATATGIGWILMLLWEVPYLLYTSRRMGFRGR